ncbi:putative Pentatricopeptide repeat-containing protein [Melia azedarach]|uniref:Pentatricopeptide repeat-containing protein n=1 Tax=Melia azedarach TaxID=155640 RepID=A0ACC1XJ85_MELAZ|nr:putative Pentatricopeptide repeat-containing protein [Melia azedarach]
MTLYMPLFRSCNNLRTLTQLHAHLLVTGLHNDPPASTRLIESYAEMGSLQSSRLAFETFRKPDSFMWAVLIKCYMWNNLFEESISLYHKMLCKQVQINNFIYPSVLRACSGFGDLGIGEKVHGRIIKCGSENDNVTQTSLLCMYGEIGCLDDARKVFDQMPNRDIVSWSSVIASYVDHGEIGEGFKMFHLMVREGAEPDFVTMLSLAEACGELSFLRLAKSVHGHALRRKMIDGPLGNSLISMYGKCGDLLSAEKLLVKVKKRCTTSWTAMISCYNRSRCFLKALESFVKMLEVKVEPNLVTLITILGSCAGLACLREGKSVHCQIIKKDIEPKSDYLGPALIEFYAECGKISECRKVLHAIGERNIVSWNILISEYAQKGMLKEALDIFVQMQAQGRMPDSYSLASSLSACGNVGLLQLGLQIHGHVTKRDYSDEFVQSSLVDMYSKCGFVNLAYLIFKRIQQKSVVTWNSMICGFSQNGNSVEAINLFHQMYVNCLEMDEVTLLTAIQACSNLGQLEKGKWVHHKLICYGIRKDIYIDTALTDMYAKCGDLQTAQRVFDSMLERNVVSWSAMIAGYGMHGQLNAASCLFKQMLDSGIKPNEVTFMNILWACSHSGSVEEGKFYFNAMRNFGVEPNLEHYACMVDLLSRRGDIEGAYKMIHSVPFPADASIWGALLNGCRIHKRIDVIKMIEKDILDISTGDTGYFTLLSNIYAEEGNWDKSGKLRSVMDVTGLKKVPGFSTI